jgi:PiT family inorganic phosphate transporter
VLYVLIVLALVFNFMNGFLGSSSCVATIIASRAMSPRVALYLSAAAVLCGPILFGTAVAYTIGKGIITPGMTNPAMIVAALASAIAWSLITSLSGIPSSPSHALVGGLVGVVVAQAGLQAVQMTGLIKVLLALFLSPVLGMAMGWIILKLTFFLAQNASLKINWWFTRSQILTGVMLALSNGANDAPKGMGILTLGLLAAGVLNQFEVQLWVFAASAAAMALGNLIGGWQIIKTLGSRFFRIRPVDSFCSQIAATSVILSAALLGGPVSTTQVVSSAILGVGAAERANKVRWNVAANIGFTWLLTIPANMLLAWGIYELISTM